MASKPQQMPATVDLGSRAIVIKRVSNVFWVQEAGLVWHCQTRARMRKEQVDVRIGDLVRLEELDLGNQSGIIAGVLERRNTLDKPPIANIDQVLVVFSASQPEFSPLTLDRFLILAGMNDIPAGVVINKAELVAPARLGEIVDPYKALGYPVVSTSARLGEVARLEALLAGRVSVFAGPSGVGKSSLLNTLDRRLELREAEVSGKQGRGRHTTTYATLYPVAGGLVADTPGYSHVEFPDWPPEELGWLFPEMVPHIPRCRLSKCLHDTEPGCAVKEDAAITEERQDTYLRFLDELVESHGRAQSSSHKSEGLVKEVGGGKKLIRLAAGAREDSRRTLRQSLSDLAAFGGDVDAEDEDEEGLEA